MRGDKEVNVKVSDLLVRALENEGVEYVFGIPGEENLDVTESLRKSKKIKLILTRHEQAAGFMAATVGRLTGNLSVALATLGPGATNLATAAAFANLGGFSCMLITGQKGIKDTTQAAFQIVDIPALMRPLTKFTTSVPHGNVLSATVRKAARIATTEKNGPVHIELPEDVASEMTREVIFDPTPLRRPVADEKGIARATEVLLQAKRPIMMIGAAANRQRAVRALNQFIKDHQIPVFCTQMGKGIVSEDSELFMGCAALSSKDHVHTAIEASDCIISVGHDETEKPPFLMTSQKRTVLHVGFLPSVVSNYWYPTCEVVGDVANAIWNIGERLKAERGLGSYASPIFTRIKQLSDVCMNEGSNDDAFPVNILRVVKDVRAALPADGILSLDNGLYKIFFARNFPALTPNSVLLDNALATMGAGLPNGLAARIALPEKKTVVITGDGGYLMNCPELQTAVQFGLDLVVLVLNDNALGMIQWKQTNMGFDSWGLDLKNPDFVMHARSFGAHGHRIEAAADLEPLLKRCIEEEGVHVIEVPISYAWAKQVLGKIPIQAAEIVRRVKEEFPDLELEDSMPGEAQEVQSDDPERDLTACKERLDHAPEAPDSRRAGKGDNLRHHESDPASDGASHGSDAGESGSAPESGAKGEGGRGAARHGFSINKGDNVPFYLAGEPTAPNSELEVTNKYTQEVFCTTARAGPEDVEKAIAAAAGPGAAKMRALPPYKRKQILLNVVEGAKRRFEEFAYMLAIEAGKPIKDARGEVGRLIDTFQIAAEEAVRIYGEYQNLEISERAEGYTSVTRRFPVGPVSMVSPFNFPLNLTAHKVAPAIAAGCSFVLKPASKTPLGALLLGELLASDPLMPKEGFSIVPCSREAGTALTEDERFKLLTFTGSPTVGWELKSRAGKKAVVLELGGNAACIVDDLSQGLDKTVSAVVHGAFYQSGQSCISVQRLLVHDSIYERFKKALVSATADLKTGDPLSEETFVGPLISANDAERVVEWIREATDGGATLLCGGEKLSDVIVSAAVVENVPRDCKLSAEEVFGPVVCLQRYQDFKAAVDLVNDSKFGLQAGVYTNNWNKANYAFDCIEAGGVCINTVPSIRIDSQAYGGIKDSGLGREGIRYALEDMTEVKVMVMKDAGRADLF